MALITVGGVALPTPSDYQVDIQDIVKADRNARGNALIELITTKRKLELAWKYLSKAELQQVLSAVSEITFSVSYEDPEVGDLKSGTFYKGDRKVGALDYIDGEIRWKDIKFNMIEV